MFTSPKTKKSRLFLPIPPPMIPLLREHKARQEAARELAGELWQENDLVFARPDGRPLDPRQDWQEFKDLLAAAGIRDLRLHDSRHTAGTILNELGVDITTIMEIFGHTQLSMTGRYVHGSTALTEEAMRRMGAALYPETETRTETTPSRAERAKRRRRIR